MVDSDRAARSHVVIENREDYLRAVSAIAEGTGPVAMDAERASGFRYSQRAYLIQVFRRGAGTFLFDPPPIGDFSDLNAAIEHEEWIFHAASQDLDCLREVGLHPRRIFDTELGARLAGLPRVGLGTVVESLLGIHLAKEHSAADWSTRPLPDSWLTYAALDVELLVDLRDAVSELLEGSDKLVFAEQEFDAVLTREPKPSARGEGWRRLNGVHSVKGGRNLAVAKELWEARDRFAQQIDTAPGRLVPDASLVAAAKAMPNTRRELAQLSEFTGRASRSELDRWWSAIELGRAATEFPTLRVPNDGPPPARSWSLRNPEADARLKAVRAVLSDLSEEVTIPMENLLTPDSLRRVAWSPPEPLSPEAIDSTLESLGARAWQRSLTTELIYKSFVDSELALVEGDESGS